MNSAEKGLGQEEGRRVEAEGLTPEHHISFSKSRGENRAGKEILLPER